MNSSISNYNNNKNNSSLPSVAPRNRKASRGLDWALGERQVDERQRQSRHPWRPHVQWGVHSG
eukprot:10862057-Prorocentrum_lima.AAC.1